MSDLLTFEQANYVWVQKLFCGYAREQSLKDNISMDIINLFCIYYQDTGETFSLLHYNDQHYKLSFDNKTITKIDGSHDSVVYGRICIPSTSPIIHVWTFKIHERSGYIGIGIDEATYIRKDQGNFSQKQGESKLYAIWSDGEKIQWNDVMNEQDTRLSFKKGDQVEMELDLLNDVKTLSFRINHNKKHIAFHDIHVDEDTIYCMAVCCWRESDNIELISCEQEYQETLFQE